MASRTSSSFSVSMTSPFSLIYTSLVLSSMSYFSAILRSISMAFLTSFLDMTLMILDSCKVSLLTFRGRSSSLSTTPLKKLRYLDITSLVFLDLSSSSLSFVPLTFSSDTSRTPSSSFFFSPSSTLRLTLS